MRNKPEAGTLDEHLAELVDTTDPAMRARGATEFFGPHVPGQLGCVFDHSAADLVVGHIDVTANLIAGTGLLFAPAVIARAPIAPFTRMFLATPRPVPAPLAHLTRVPAHDSRDFASTRPRWATSRGRNAQATR
jgi:hypothetical protein